MKRNVILFFFQREAKRPFKEDFLIVLWEHFVFSTQYDLEFQMSPVMLEIYMTFTNIRFYFSYQCHIEYLFVIFPILISGAVKLRLFSTGKYWSLLKLEWIGYYWIFFLIINLIFDNGCISSWRQRMNILRLTVKTYRKNQGSKGKRKMLCGYLMEHKEGWWKEQADVPNISLLFLSCLIQ